MLACGSDPEIVDEEPVAAASDPNAPRRYRVLRGDTLRTIASKRSCQPSDLINWNDLGPDPFLVPGQILKIYRANQAIARRPNVPSGDDSEALPGQTPDLSEGDGVAVVDLPDPSSAPLGGDDPGDGRPAARPGPVPRTNAPVPSGPRPSAPPARPQPSQPPSTQPQRIVVNADGKRMSRHGTEILSLLDEIGDSKLENVKTVSGSGETPGEAGLKGRSLGGAGSADDSSVSIDRPGSGSSPGTSSGGAPKAPSSVPKLAKAQPKKCLQLIMEDLGDKGMATPDGLDRDGIRAGMAPIVKGSGGCLTGAGSGSWDIHLELTVGCDGMVYNTDVIMDGGLPRDVARCVAQVADQGSFPAAQGVTTFVFPIRFSK